MKRDVLWAVGIGAALVFGGWSHLEKRHAVRAQIEAGIQADRIQQDLDDTRDQLTATVLAHASLKQHTDSADTALAKAKANARRTTATLVAFRDSVGRLPPPATASDSVVRLTALVAAVSSDAAAKDTALAKSDSVIRALRKETALLHGSVTRALASLDSTASEHADYVRRTKDWGPPRSMFDKARDTSIALAIGYFIGGRAR